MAYHLSNEKIIVFVKNFLYFQKVNWKSHKSLRFQYNQKFYQKIIRKIVKKLLKNDFNFTNQIASDVPKHILKTDILYYNS